MWTLEGEGAVVVIVREPAAVEGRRRAVGAVVLAATMGRLKRAVEELERKEEPLKITSCWKAFGSLGEVAAFCLLEAVGL